MFPRAAGCVFQTEGQREFFAPYLQKNSRIILNPIHDKYIGVTEPAPCPRQNKASQRQRLRYNAASGKGSVSNNNSQVLPAEGTEIVVEIRNEEIHLPLGVDAVKLKGLSDYLQNDAFLFPLGGDNL